MPGSSVKRADRRVAKAWLARAGMALALLCPAASAAQDRSDLNRLESEIKTQRGREAELVRKSQTLAAELAELRQRSIGAARATQDSESLLTRLERKLRQTQEDLKRQEETLALRREQIGGTLIALERLSRNPPRALLLSPKQYRTDELVLYTALFQVLLTAFLCTIAVLVLLESLGHDTRLDRVIFAGIGLILMVVGGILGRVRKNFFLGIRTPWTMRNDEVWDRTHRLGGKMFMLAGLLLVINAFVRLDLRLTLPAVVVLMLIPVVYSWIIYRQLRGKDAAG